MCKILRVFNQQSCLLLLTNIVDLFVNSLSQLKKTEGQGSPRGQGHLRSEGISEMKTEERKEKRIKKVNILTK